MTKRIVFGFAFLACVSLLAAQDGAGKVQTGLKPDSLLPGPFDSYNINGKKGKGRQHCLVCEFGLSPVVMVFAKESPEGKDGALDALLAKLDAAVDKNQSKDFASFVVFLSPDARNSANTKEENAKNLVEEARAREALIARLEARSEKLKNVVVACMPEAPKAYGLDPKAETTVVFYWNHKVIGSFVSLAPMTEADADKILKVVTDTLAKQKKPAKN
ncbi:MAG: hypothetical protein L0Y72_06755 [Gemmataceae bacterium]|nr:hypothetical protein [Gemmataceae bacterium]